MFNRISQSKIFHRQICITSKIMCLASEAPQFLSLDSNAPGSEESIESKRKRLSNLRNKYPEFLPNPVLELRNSVRELLEREDMLKRRKHLLIPEFYVGSILAVTTSDKNAPNKVIRFLGICIMRSGYGLTSNFILRNTLQNEGIEVLYNLYSPLIEQIDVIKLEKRLDDELLYLRDAPLKYSTFPFDMDPQYIDESADVPINTLKVPLNPKPWYAKWERMNLQGAILPPLPEKTMKKAEKHKKPWEKYDLMDQYRNTIPEEEENYIFSGIYKTLKELQVKQSKEKQKKSFEKLPKQKLF